MGHSMARSALLLAALFVAPIPAFGAGDGDLFAEAPANTADSAFRSFDPRGGRALSITIESGIQFSKLALRGKQDGDAAIDAQSGVLRTDTNMVSLGGMVFQGKARVTGEPLRPIRIDMPSHITLRSPDGSQAELSDFHTDLDGVALLDADGVLVFNFGATLTSKNASGGNFRGRIPIRVEYF